MTADPGAPTTLLAPPVEGIGDCCVRQGWTTPERVQECLRAQAEYLRRGKPVPRLGELLVSRGYLRAEQVARALSILGQRILECRTCGLRVNSPRHRNASAFMCPRCHRPLIPDPAAARLDVDDASPIVVPAGPLPDDVLRAARDPSRRLGKYLLLRELGRGGSGQVYLAWDSFLCQRVALKRLRSDLDRDAAEGLETAAWRAQGLVAEARHVVRLRHPGIVAVYEVGRLEGDLYVSMEYVEGRPLDTAFRLVHGRGAASAYAEDPRGVLTMLAGVASALHYAHTRPVPLFHCDLKPANVIVDAEGQPRVLDFGLARPQDALGEDGVICGTPGYMAPEQAAGRNTGIDARTDVYALGAVLYEALCGRPPFEGDAAAVLERTLNEAPRPPGDVLSGMRIRVDDGPLRPPGVEVPPFLEDLCLSCLAKRKDDRPTSMLEVADLLRRAARPPAALSISPTRVPDAAERQRVRRRGSFRSVLLAAALPAVLAVAVLLVLPSRSPEVPVGEGDVVARLAAFQPDRAAALARVLGSEPLLQEAEALERLRRRILERLPAELDVLLLRERTLLKVRLLGGDASALRIAVDSRELPVPWSDLDPSQVLWLARSAGGAADPDARRAMARYCHRVGRRSDARELSAD
jgi:serine/threonine protein kinase